VHKHIIISIIIICFIISGRSRRAADDTRRAAAGAEPDLISFPTGFDADCCRMKIG